MFFFFFIFYSALLYICQFFGYAVNAMALMVAASTSTSTEFFCPCYFKWCAFWYVSLNFIFIIIDAIHKFRDERNKKKKKLGAHMGDGGGGWRGEIWKLHARIHTELTSSPTTTATAEHHSKIRATLDVRAFSLLFHACRRLLNARAHGHVTGMCYTVSNGWNRYQSNFVWFLCSCCSLPAPSIWCMHLFWTYTVPQW